TDARGASGAACRAGPSGALVDAIRESGGLGAPWLTYRDLAAHPQLAAERMLIEVPRGHGPPLRLVGWPWSAARTPAALRRPAPALGEHTAALPELLVEPE